MTSVMIETFFPNTSPYSKLIQTNLEIKLLNHSPHLKEILFQAVLFLSFNPSFTSPNANES